MWPTLGSRTAKDQIRSDIQTYVIILAGIFPLTSPQPKYWGDVSPASPAGLTAVLRLNLQLHTIDFVRICRISSFCTVAWQLAKFQLTQRIARSLGDSGASCLVKLICRQAMQKRHRQTVGRLKLRSQRIRRCDATRNNARNRASARDTTQCHRRT